MCDGAEEIALEGRINLAFAEDNRRLLIGVLEAVAMGKKYSW